MTALNLVRTERALGTAARVGAGAQPARALYFGADASNRGRGMTTASDESDV
jgi:hypothetical protein